MKMRDIPMATLDQIKALDIEEYLEYLKLYEKDGKTFTNTERGIARKLASLKTFYNYFSQSSSLFNLAFTLYTISVPRL